MTNQKLFGFFKDITKKKQILLDNTVACACTNSISKSVIRATTVGAREERLAGLHSRKIVMVITYHLSLHINPIGLFASVSV